MKRIYNNYFLVGLFTILIGGAAIFLLLIMGGKNDAADNYYSYFKNVTGLGYGNPVYYEGYRVGQVEGIEPETIDGKLLFKTEYTIIEGWKVPIDSMTKIESSGLLSDMSLSIHAGVADTYLSPDSEIKGVMGDDIMTTISKLANNFDTLNQEKITPLLDLIYKRTDVLTQSLETQIPQILTSIDDLIKDLNKLVLTADTLLGKDNLEGIDRIILNLDALSSKLSSAGGWVDSTLKNINNLVATGEQMVNNSNDKVGTLLDLGIKTMAAFSDKSETIASEMESASMNINEATETIRRNPSSLVFDKKSKVADEDL